MQYSIRELEKLSGIKAHTIRIWEKRYKLIEPGRTETNIRLYSDDDLKKIINVAIANNAGVKISHIARMSENQLTKIISDQNLTEGTMSATIDQLVLSMIDLHEQSFEEIIRKLSVSIGFEETVLQVLYPFLEKIGVLWQTGNITPAHEHFVSNLIRQKIIVAIDSLPHPPQTAQKAVLFLQENEYHEIGLLFYCYLVKKNGIQPIYLGQSVPYDDLLKVAKIHAPRFLITSVITTINQGLTEKYFDMLSADFEQQNIFISGQGSEILKKREYPKITFFSSAKALSQLLKS